MECYQFMKPNVGKENKNLTVNLAKEVNSPSSCLKTPNGSKVNNPIITHLITNKHKSFINEDMFMEKESTPCNDEFLSPDLAGILFPKEINTNEQKLKNLDNLYTNCHQYFRRKSSSVFFYDSILPSPDSGMGNSIMSSRLSLSSCNESESKSTYLVPSTPPSDFKWNRDEYRSCDISEIEESFDSDYYYIDNNLESTKLLGKTDRLADNSSMFQHSEIRSYSSTNDYDSDDSFVPCKRLKRCVDNNLSISSLLKDANLNNCSFESPLMMENKDCFISSPNDLIEFETKPVFDLSPIIHSNPIKTKKRLQFDLSPISKIEF